MQWGTFSLVAATRAMLRAGLRDPLNAKFVLLSESGIPLYPPQTLYQQLMSETKSRINACNTDPTVRDTRPECCWVLLLLSL